MNKHLFASKTFWLNVIGFAVPFLNQGAMAYVTAHPVAAIGIGGALNIANRIFGTSGPVDVLPRF